MNAWKEVNGFWRCNCLCFNNCQFYFIIRVKWSGLSSSQIWYHYNSSFLWKTCALLQIFPGILSNYHRLRAIYVLVEWMSWALCSANGRTHGQMHCMCTYLEVLNREAHSILCISSNTCSECSGIHAYLLQTIYFVCLVANGEHETRKEKTPNALNHFTKWSIFNGSARKHLASRLHCIDNQWKEKETKRQMYALPLNAV